MAATLNAIGIVSKDIERSLKFYAMLGVATPRFAKDEDHFEATLENGIRLMWDTVELMKQLTPEWVPPTGHRLGLAFLCDDASDVDRVYHSVVDAGFAGVKEPWDAFWGQRYAQVKDPDDNVIDLFAPI